MFRTRLAFVSFLVLVSAAVLLTLGWVRRSRWIVFGQGGPPVVQFGNAVTYQFNVLSHPTGLVVAVDRGCLNLALYIADSDNHVIRGFNMSTHDLFVLAGSVGQPGYRDYPPGSTDPALFRNPTGLAGGVDQGVDATGRPYCYSVLWVADAENFRIRTIVSGVLLPPPTITGVYGVYTAAGNGTQGFVDGSSLSASFAALGGVLPPGRDPTHPPFYICDTQNHAIRYWDGNNVTTFAGNGSPGYTDGYRTSAQFNCPGKITSDTSGNLYVADMGNHVIRKIDTSGNVTTFAGSGQLGYADGSGTAAQFHMPCGIIFNPADNYLYVADSGNNMIRRIDLSGNVTTYAGRTQAGLVNGQLSQAQFACPMELVILNGSMYISDMLNNVIRHIDMVNQTVDTYIS